MTQTKAELLQTRHQGDIRLGDADSTHYVGFKAPATVGTSLVWTLPAADGTAGYYLKTDGSGNLGGSLDNSGVTLSGSTNNTIATVTGANALQGEANLTFNGSSLGIGTNGSITTGSNFSLNGNALTVTGTAGTVIEGKRAGSATIQATNTTNSTDLQLRADATGGLVRTASNNPLVFGTNQTERMRINTSGHVGIGNANPAALLDIANTGGAAEIILSSSTQPRLMLKTTGTTAECRVDFGDSGDSSRGAIGYSHSDDALKFYVQGVANERARIDSVGRLLIGVTAASPVYGLYHQLQVEGTNGATSSASLTRNSNDANPAYLTFGKTRGTSDGSNTIVQNGDDLGTISFNGADGTNKDHMAAQITGAIDGTPGENDLPGRLVFKTTADGANSSTERLRISSTGVSKFTGGVSQAATAMGALDLDLRTSNYFTKTISGNSTFTFSNPAASGTVTTFTLELTHSSGTVTWPSSVKWNADTAPTLTTGKTHLFMFVTDDGGSRYRGSALVDYVN